MTAEENKSLVQKYYSAYNTGDLDLAAGLADENIVVSLIPLNQTFHGIAEFKRYLKLLKNASQDAQVELVTQVATETNIANEFVFRGTQTGTLPSSSGELPATGNAIELQACDVWEVKDGRIIAIRTYFDGALLSKQLGLPTE